ncbi:MAG: DNA alkylation repair protein [bacterium]|nr:DNA alkylation repair protein [bacterium]
MEPLKEMFNRRYYQQLAKALSKTYQQLEAEKFIQEATTSLEALSLNERMRRTSTVLKKHLPQDYTKSIIILKKTIPNTPRGYTNLVFPDFVGLYGHEHPDLSLDALKYFTTFGSSEFAIREFLKRDFSRVIKTMIRWSKDPDPQVRRLASEGSRPRLPWSFKLEEVIQQPELTRPILENLKADEELYVRKSVANHLNDLSKDNTNYMLRLVKTWDKKNPHTYWIIKHASRTLIKKGHPASLSLFNFEKAPQIKVGKLTLGEKKIKLGETLNFEFGLSSTTSKPQKLVIDYIIHYRKKNSTFSPKVFKLKEMVLAPGEKVVVKKKQIIKDFSTRKHEAGLHKLSIQINGKVFCSEDFFLLL